MMHSFPAQTAVQLGAVLRGYRRERGLTQGELASRIGLTQKAISLAETAPERMGVERLFRILAGLNVELLLRDRAAAPGRPAEW
jgi:HTH-type transcriptional regulator/antitoxin HipB